MFDLRDYIYNNKEYFLSLKPKYNNYLVIGFIIVFISISTCLLCFKFYDVTPSKIIVKKNHEYYETILLLNYENYKLIAEGNYIIIDGKKYKYKMIQKDIKIEDNNLENYLSLIIKINLDKKYLKNNLILDVKIYSNYERGIKKIKKMIV